MPTRFGTCSPPWSPTRSTVSSRSQRSQEVTASSERLTFPYAAIIPDSPIKPAVPLRLHSVDGRKRYPLFALPDSGADFSCFPDSWASALGIDLAGCAKRRVNTGAGTTHHYEWSDPIIATVADREVRLRASFGPILVGVLGRMDFFAEFLVQFDERNKWTHLQPHDDRESGASP